MQLAGAEGRIAILAMQLRRAPIKTVGESVGNEGRSGLHAS